MIVDIETSVGMAIKRPAQDAVAIDLLPMASIGHSRAVWSNRDIDCNLSAASIFFTEEEVLPTSGDRGNGEKVGSVLSWG